MLVPDLLTCALQPAEEVRQTLADVHIAEQQNLQLVVGTLRVLCSALVGTDAYSVSGGATCRVTILNLHAFRCCKPLALPEYLGKKSSHLIRTSHVQICQSTVHFCPKVIIKWSHLSSTFHSNHYSRSDL